MPYTYNSFLGHSTYTLPIKMVEDSNLPSWTTVGKYRPVIMRSRIGSNGYDECHQYMLDADDGQYYVSPEGITWLQQCWLLPDMTARSEYPALYSTVTGTTAEHWFKTRPWAYAHPLNPTSVYKFVRSGNFTYDVAEFGEPLTYGWGGSGHSVHWVDNKTPGNMSLDVKRIASYLKDRSSLPSNHNYCRIVVDFIGLNNYSVDDTDIIGRLGFLRDRYSIYSGGGVTYETPIHLCGSASGVELGNKVQVATYATRGNFLALHLNMTGFNINNTANSTASKIIWDLLPVCEDVEGEVPQRACIRISIVSAPSLPHDPVSNS
jgi:hypothetical protein